MTETLAPDQTRVEFNLALQDARAYLDSLALQEDLDPDIADSDGLVTYINGTSNPPPAELVEERKQISRVLEGLTGVVTSAILATAGTDDAAKHDPNLWKEPVRKGLSPFISGFAEESLTYQRRVQGVEIATQFLNILIDAVSEPGGALDSFKKFLAGQGETIKLNGSDTQEGYKYACIGMVHEIFQIEGGAWIYVPKIRMYFTEFTRKTFNISTGCASYDEYHFNFTVEKMIAPFKLETWRQESWFREEVDDFIQTYMRADIERSKNYFDGIFKSQKSGLTH